MSGSNPPPDTSGQLTDPFNFAQANSNAPGLFGQTQGFWRDMAQLGANISSGANARDARGFLVNPGFGGAVASGIGQTYENGRQNAVTRSALDFQGAQTTGKQIENVVNASGLPLAVARNRMLTNIYQHPDQLQGMMQGFMGGASPGGAVPGLGAAESGNNPQAVNSQGYSGQYQFGAGRLNELGMYQPAPNENLKANQWGGTFNIPGFPQVKTQADFLSNPQAQQAAYQAHIQNIDQNIAQTPGAQGFNQTGLRAVAHLGGVDGMKQFVASGGRYNPADANGTHLTDYYTKFSDPGGGAPQGGQQPGPMVPGGRVAPSAAGQQYISQASQYFQQANQVELMKSLGLPMAGDPATLRAQGNEFLKTGLQMQTAGPIAGQQAGAKAGVDLVTAGPIQAAKSANSNVDIRPGGMSRLVEADQSTHFVKNPQLERAQTSTGSTIYTHISPAMPDAPPGTPGTSEPVLDNHGQPVVEKLPPNVQDAQNKAYTDFAGRDTDSYIAAQNTHQWLEQMNHAADTLNQHGGFLGTGPTAPERLAFANGVNDILRTAGLPTAFDPKALASWEELKKATTTAGFELSSHYEGHARQAAQTIMNATSAVPSIENSPMGFKMVSAGIQEAAQNAIDLHEFAKQPVYDAHGNLVKAETDFYKNVPSQMYARRAISTVTPYPVKTDTELNRYLPGTFVNYKGNIVQVPARPGMPPAPEYLSGVQRPEAGATQNVQ